jgi:hypothetical protein
MGGNGSVTAGGPPNGGAANGGNGGVGGGGGGLTGTGLSAGGTGGFGGGGGGGYFNPGCSNPRGGGNGGFGGGGGSGANGGGFGASEFGGGSGAASINCSDSGGGGGAGFGGAVFNNQGTVTVINSTLSGNTAQGGSGGTSTDAQPAANGGSGFGGGIFNRNGSVTVVNATLAFNTVTGGTGTTAGTTAGGAIYNYQSGGAATLTLLNSILSNTVANGNDCTNNAGTVSAPAANKNLIILNNGCGTPAVTSDPLLGTLQDNSGFTFTHALMSGSPAIDTGNNSVTGAPYSLTTDQRGTVFVRQYNGTVDIGAFETQIVNTAPTFTPAAAINRQQGSPSGAAVAIGIVADGQTAPGSLTVTPVAGGTATGITVTSITNNSGTIMAQISADCSATSGTVSFQVSDGSLAGTGDLQVNVTANTQPALAYSSPQSVTFGGSLNVTPTTASDNGTVSYQVLAGHGLTTAPTVDAAGVVTISNAAPVGMHTITIRATDNCATSTDASFTLTANPGPLHHFAIDPISAQTAGAAFNITLTAQDANNNTVTSFTGTVNLSTTAGTITPTTSGTFTSGTRTQSVTVTQSGTGKTISANDASGHSGTSSTFNVGCPAITVSPSSLPNGTVGVAYNHPLSASGGTGSYTFAVTAGSPPTGLTLNSNGTWSGTPSAANTFDFTVTATDTISNLHRRAGLHCEHQQRSANARQLCGDDRDPRRASDRHAGCCANQHHQHRRQVFVRLQWHFLHQPSNRRGQNHQCASRRNLHRHGYGLWRGRLNDQDLHADGAERHGLRDDAALSSAPNISIGSPYGPAVGDFNNDGKQDLAIANNSSASVLHPLGRWRGRLHRHDDRQHGQQSICHRGRAISTATAIRIWPWLVPVEALFRFASAMARAISAARRTSPPAALPNPSRSAISMATASSISSPRTLARILLRSALAMAQGRLQRLDQQSVSAMARAKSGWAISMAMATWISPPPIKMPGRFRCA